MTSPGGAGALKPCGCGGKAVYEDVSVAGGPHELWYIECIACGIGTKYHTDRESAAETWNRRAPDPVVAEVVKILRDRTRDFDFFLPRGRKLLDKLADRFFLPRGRKLLDKLADRLERGE